MASFDIIECAGQSYRFLWAERHYIARLAAVPLLVKLACFVIIDLYADPNDLIGQALVMLPAYFMDGWLLSHVARFALFGQRWPFRTVRRTVRGRESARHDLRVVQVVQDRVQGLLIGTLVYVLARFLAMGLLAPVFLFVNTLAPAGGPQTSPPSDLPPDMATGVFFALMVLLAAGVWAFRLSWLFIAAAGNVSMTGFLRRVKGFSISFNMLGVWMLCALPLVSLAMLVIWSMVHASGPDGKTLAPDAVAILMIVKTLVDTLILVAATFAMSIGIRPFLADVASENAADERGAR